MNEKNGSSLDFIIIMLSSPVVDAMYDVPI